jgi:UDP-glucose 4-epimerase
MKILVTGAAGFIGSRLCEALLHHDHQVVGVDDLSTGRLANVPNGVDLLEADVSESWSLLDIGRFDLVYHAAASYKDRDNWERDARTNVLGTLNVIRAAQRWDARLVYFQTSLCYGLAPHSPVPLGAALDPRGSYAVSKTAGEAYIRDSGLSYVSLRLANIYGPRNLSGPVPTFFQRLSEGRPCTIADSRRDFVFVDDLVWVAVKAGSIGQGAYHVASGSDVSIRAIYCAVASAMGLTVTVPDVVPRGPDDAPSILLDPSETERTFGWTAKTELYAGIERAVEWYRANGVTETFTHLAMKG